MGKLRLKQVYTLRMESGHTQRRIRLPARRRSHYTLAVIVFAVMAVGLFFVSVVSDNLGLEEKPVLLGATFSKSYAESLGLDWKLTYLAILDDLHVPTLRIPAYWNDVERSPGKFDFSNIDFQVDGAAKRGVKIILAIGRKLPRWPECHVPDWARMKSEDEQQARIISYVEKTVRRYARYDAVVSWQVENEPFFDFGQCPKPDRDFLKREIAAVKSIDARPIVISESGELSTWTNAASMADVLGISTYRIVWDKHVGFLFWPVTPRYYAIRASVVRPFVDRIIITELQAEPWSTAGILHLPIDEQLRLMSPERLRDNVLFVKRIGFPEAYLWGAEWWFWLKTRGRPEMWDQARQLYLENRLPVRP